MQDIKNDNDEHLRIERHYGKYERTHTLQDTVSADKVAAEYKNGIRNLNCRKLKKRFRKKKRLKLNSC